MKLVSKYIQQFERKTIKVRDFSNKYNIISYSAIDYINRTIQTTPSSKAKKQKKQQTLKQNIRNGDTKHSRALQLEKAVNKKISDTITQINSSKQYAKHYETFELILTSEDAKEIFIFLSRRFHGDLINSLLSGKNGLKVFKDGQLNEYSKLIISFLCGHYQMPAKFNKYNDPTDFFHNAINKNNSRFLTWFGIRYYIDLVSASKNKQYNSYIKRRLHEAALFELVERKENGTIDMYQTSKDIFTHLNIIFKFIKSDDNVPLYGYKNKTFLEFITTHNYSHLIDKVAANKKNNISFSTNEEYSSVFKNVTKIQDLKNCLHDSMSIDENKYFQSILDFAKHDDIFKPFLLYINEKFSKNILNIGFKLNEIYVVSNTNLKDFQNLLKKYFNSESTEQKNILLISQLNWGMHQRFDNLLDEYEQQTIILYLLKNKEHVLTMDNISKNNFRILLYDDNESINAVVLAGKYTLINDDNDEKILYQHEESKEIQAEYLPNENIFTIIHQETKVSLRNFFPSKFHAGIILSNQEEIKEDQTAVSQVGEISITIEFILDETVNTGEIEKKKYYLYNVKTQELIDGIVEVCGDTASACFKINADTDDISNTKLIFSFYKKDFSDKKEANIKSHDTIILDKATRESKETTVNALINKGDISGFIRGVELFEPTKDNLPDIDSYMETEYKFKATTSGVVNTDYIKWCYAVLTNSEYRGKVKISTVSEQISQTGEEITFKPKDILSDSSKKKLENKDISAKLYIFAYMKSPAYNTKHGKTHSVCKVKSNVKIEEKLSEHFSLSELVNTSYTEHLEENRQYAMEEDNYLKLTQLCTDILEPIRTYINGGNSAGKKSIIITSGVRCPELNDAIKGSSKTSQHMFCEAVDFVLDAKDESERKDKLVSLFKDIYNKKVDNLDINNIYQCIIERNKSGSYWLHIGLKTQNRQNQSTSFTVMVQINNDADFIKIKYDGSKDFFTKHKF
ncbi:D-Ala-D-Ala carboxypeptidase family metallohydrolase [Mucispirillum schaedleri]|uniref:Peptidase M15A C-terminal domain-containing protein n=1 Tax=Mucispirillum schaedleri ASF457 TaxID=1379858 RepID=A0AA97LR39_9BACT|nr:D-Ala-D-Ala carboxypeptidase family metallohydrolase [Mucispirillum schaedleri]USF25048.1 hypothetical protein N508_002143 [Mucispirillum schaedleri ASF457]